MREEDDLGTCLAAAFGGTVVAFSWWGVNLLGVGLHSYGFTSGIQRALWTYYVVQWSIVGLGGGIVWLRRRSALRTTSSGDARASLGADVAPDIRGGNVVPPALPRRAAPVRKTAA